MQMRLRFNHCCTTPEDYKAFTLEEFKSHVVLIAKLAGLEKIRSINLVGQEDCGIIGKCHGLYIDGQWTLASIDFINTIINGKDFTLQEINEAITHEICHALTNTEQNRECEHDCHWERTCRKLNYSPYKEYSKPSCDSLYYVEAFDEYQNIRHFSLRCGKCGRVFHRSDAFNYEMLQLFFRCMNPTVHDLALLALKSSCCEAPYRYEFESKALLKELRKKDVMHGLQASIIRNEMMNINRIAL